MTTLTPPRRHDHRRQQRQLTVAAAILAVAVLMVVGLVYFGGLKLRVGREAAAIAEESARAGAGELDRSRAYTSGRKVVDPAAAVARARHYLAAASQNGGVTGSVALEGGTTVRVTVTVTRPAAMLDLIGVSSISVTQRNR